MESKPILGKRKKELASKNSRLMKRLMAKPNFKLPSKANFKLPFIYFTKQVINVLSMISGKENTFAFRAY